MFLMLQMKLKNVVLALLRLISGYPGRAKEGPRWSRFYLR